MVALLAECRARMPAYMVPSRLQVREGPLPRNPKGKIDRKSLSSEEIGRMAGSSSTRFHHRGAKPWSTQ